MGKVGIVEVNREIVGYIVKSPASGEHVLFYTNPKYSPGVWMFNGDMDKPTFSPSMLLYPNAYHGREHFFVRNGTIEYLQDCDHHMAGMTVEMVDVDEEDG